ncbi:hypothetical protein [Serratia fonticola]|uniref:hypothetical protein n=1 Tax=Serratia fonticola TaxID=47917 RepID=UPI0015C67005|nr:hypothetical protein [Serratia fonticola]NYA15766.1 hypothetical protein [Serratia fonticola]NYA35886.1 hypothetical protein [Serratia fonticola]
MLKMIGVFILVVGIIWTGSALGLVVTVGYTDKVYNNGLIALRQLHAMVGLTLSVIGSITVLAGLIIGKMDKHAKAALEAGKTTVCRESHSLNEVDVISNEAIEGDPLIVEFAAKLKARMPNATAKSILVTYLPEINEAKEALPPAQRNKFDRDLEIELIRITAK